MPFGDVALPARKMVTYIAMPRCAIGEKKAATVALSPHKIAAVGI
jgi:hypothetical protein